MSIERQGPPNPCLKTRGCGGPFIKSIIWRTTSSLKSRLKVRPGIARHLPFPLWLAYHSAMDQLTRLDVLVREGDTLLGLKPRSFLGSLLPSGFPPSQIRRVQATTL